MVATGVSTQVGSVDVAEELDNGGGNKVSEELELCCCSCESDEVVVASELED